MSDKPYVTVGAPQSYAAPIVNLFGQQGQQQQQQQKPQQSGQPQNPGQQMGQGAGQAFAALLKRFMQPGAPQQPGDPMQLQSSPAPQMNAQGLGLY